jgi:hypothetical protein
MAKVTLHDMEEHRELSRDEADNIAGGQNNYGTAANTGNKTGGAANNYGDQTGGSGAAGGDASGSTSGSNFSGSGGSVSQWAPFGSGGLFDTKSQGGAGGNISNIGAVGGSGGAGGSAVGAEGGDVTDNIITEISIPVTMKL